MICKIQKNNLYDSVINEAEKITEYEKHLSKYNNFDLSMLKEYEFDVDLLMFIHSHNQELITDRMFRSYINIKHAIDRCYASIISELNSPKTSYAIYTPIPFYELYNLMDRITKSYARRKIYDDASDPDIHNLSFLEFCEKKDNEIEEAIEKLDVEKIIVSKDVLKDATTRCFDHIMKFMTVMRCELERKPYYKQTSIITKHIFHVVLMTANVAITVSIE